MSVENISKVKKVIILGSGTSTGVPVIGCSCDVCASSDPKNKRMRASIALYNEHDECMVVDTTPDFRQQVLTHGIKKLQHVFYTHTHADHCHGFDDLRAFCFQGAPPVQCYSTAPYLAELKERFAYAFSETPHYNGAKPKVELNEITEKPFRMMDWDVDPVFLQHGGIKTVGIRIGNFAYATDFKRFTPDDIARWRGKVHTMVASGIRHRPHPSHSTIQETVELFQALEVQQGFITHISHEIDHEKDNSALPAGIQLAYDGMVIDVNP